MDGTYTIPKNFARMIAVGLYKDIGTHISSLKATSPTDYSRFVADYTARQASEPPAPVKRRYSRNRRASSR
jgi:hypothetical protein